jgi:hypothetical protein
VLRALPLLVWLSASVALAHPQGFHVKLTFTLTPTTVTGLLLMDVDAGQRCLLLREAADESRDGLLDAGEVKGLERRLAAMLTRNLKLGISGAPIPVVVKETRLSLRDDPRANDAGFSVAVLIEVAHPHAVSPGMQFEVENVSPDLSAMTVEVLQAGAPASVAQVESGKKYAVRLLAAPTGTARSP